MLLDKTRVDYDKDKEDKKDSKPKKTTAAQKEMADFNRKLAEKYMTKEERTERLRESIKKEKE